jgi:hypothetical protein
MVAKIKFVPHSLNEEEETYHAVIEHTETLTRDDIFNEMEWHGSTLTKTDMLACFESHDRAIVRALLLGKGVVTDMVHYKLTAKGVFNEDGEPVNGSEGPIICASVSLGPLLRNEVNNNTVKVERKPASKPRPQLDHYINLHNGDPNTILSPTHMARLKGDKLRFDPEDPEQGLFLVPQVNGSPLADTTPIRVEDIARLTDKEIIFRVPDAVPAGTYKIEVRRRFGQTRLASGMLEDLLTVS